MFRVVVSKSRRFDSTSGRDQRNNSPRCVWASVEQKPIQNRSQERAAPRLLRVDPQYGLFDARGESIRALSDEQVGRPTVQRAAVRCQRPLQHEREPGSEAGDRPERGAGRSDGSGSETQSVRRDGQPTAFLTSERVGTANVPAGKCVRGLQRRCGPFGGGRRRERIAGWPTRCKTPGPYNRESADRFSESPRRGFQC